MALVEIEFDASSLSAMLARLPGELDRSMGGAGGAMALSLDIVAADARTRAPVSPGSAAEGESAVAEATGFLLRSINTGPVEGDFVTGITGTVSASAPYALHVEYGTKAHIIRPKNKKALRWASGGGAGGWAFAKSVKHPGTTAQPFLRPALTASRDAILNRFSVATRLAIARAKAGAR